MNKTEIQRRAERHRRVGHLFVDVSSIVAILAGLGRSAYEYFIGKDLAFGREALVLGIVSAILLYVVGHPVVEIEYRENLENKN